MKASIKKNIKKQEQEEIRVKMKLFETCLMPAILYGFEACGEGEI